MLESGWLFLGRIAFVWTLLALLGAVYLDDRDETADGLIIVAGAVGVVLWGVWTFGALNIEVVDGGVAYEFTHPELAIVSVVMGVISGYLALTGPFDIILRARDAELRDL